VKLLIQRVKKANVLVDKKIVADISNGLLVFVGIEKNDTTQIAQKLIDKLLKYRIFNDENNKMNLNVVDMNAEILLVSQFTLVADTKKGNRPRFQNAMSPKLAEFFFREFVQKVIKKHPQTQQGIFGADMQVSLINDGPVTFLLD